MSTLTDIEIDRLLAELDAADAELAALKLDLEAAAATLDEQRAMSSLGWLAAFTAGAVSALAMGWLAGWLVGWGVK